jgi:hypothetical protein
MAASPRLLDSGVALSGHPERGSGRCVPLVGRPQRMAVVPCSLPTGAGQIRPALDRSVCEPEEHDVTSVFLPLPGPVGGGTRCVPPGLGRGEKRVRSPSLHPDTQDLGEGEARQGDDHVSRPAMGGAIMDGRPHRAFGAAAADLDGENLGGASGSAAVGPDPTVMGDLRLEDLRQRLVVNTQDISGGVADRIIAKYDSRQLRTHIRTWNRVCHE